MPPIVKSVWTSGLGHANLAAVLKAGGAKIEDVIKTTIYLTDLSNFEIVNKIYSDFFNVENPPARACVEVSSLPKGV